MKVSICFRYLHILLVLLIEFNLEAVSTTFENSTIIGETLTNQSVQERVSKRIQTIVFHGCFSVWKGQRSRLEPPGRSSQFDELNNVASCTEKCRLKVTFKIVLTYIVACRVDTLFSNAFNTGS